MEITSTTYTKYKIFIAAVCVVIATQVFFQSSAYAQLGFYYGKNTKGFRIGGGPGFSNLMTHYDSNPLTPVFVGNLDYAFNPYFSIGGEGQIGKLKGVDTKGYYFYQTSTDSYMYANINMKFGVGLLSDFNSHNQFMDAVKRFYIGVGGGIIATNIQFTYNTNITTKYGEPLQKDHETVATFFTGTYIDLPGVWGADKLELCPQFQFSYVNSYYLDGFVSKQGSTLKGFFNVTSLTLRYKF
jgi:hypothetical protein